MAKLIVIDNYDSFTYNLVQMFRCYDLQISVHRSDKIDTNQVARTAPDYILISPGPKTPSQAGISLELIATLHQQVPILGVCLGMQCINEVFGGQTLRAPVPVHGKVSRIRHSGKAVFDSMPNPFYAARYHSLMVQPAPDTPLMVTAHADDTVIMGISHRDLPVHGVQFHPESFMTTEGVTLIENFLRLGPLNPALARD